MQTLRLTSLLLIISSLFFIMSSCGKDEKSDAEKQFEQLQGTWVISTVTLDGADRKSDYTNFEIVFSGTHDAIAYAANKRTFSNPNVWKGSGTAVFVADNVKTKMTTDSGGDKKDITYSLTATSLRLTFDFTGAGYTSRLSKITGKWIFNFTKKP